MREGNAKACADETCGDTHERREECEREQAALAIRGLRTRLLFRHHWGCLNGWGGGAQNGNRRVGCMLAR